MAQQRGKKKDINPLFWSCVIGVCLFCQGRASLPLPDFFMMAPCDRFMVALPEFPHVKSIYEGIDIGDLKT
jgi:hypothetical protein